MKKFFSTPGRAVVSTIVIGIVLLIFFTSIGAIAVGRGFIGKSAAKRVALQDAGLEEADVSALRARLDFDDGRFQYEVDFYCDGVEYDYAIQAGDGDIISRDIEGGGNAYRRNEAAPQQENPVVPQQESPVVPQQESPAAPSQENPAVLQQESSVAPSQENPVVSPQESSVAPRQETASVSETAVQPTDALTDNGAGQTKDAYIGADLAKQIALDHAQLNEGDVRFIKAELDYDDGRMEYEVEFYLGRTEYDYTIDAVSGDILKYDVDRD